MLKQEVLMLKFALRSIYVLVTLTIFLIVAIYFLIFARSHPSGPGDALISFDDFEAFIETFQIAQTQDHAVEIYEENYFTRDTSPIKTYVSSFGASAEVTSNDIH